MPKAAARGPAQGRRASIGGGQETVLRRGHATGTVISSGGYELVSSGGTTVATHISGGTLEVASGGTASGIVFSRGGTLQLDTGSHLSGTISGLHFGEEIDLRGLAFSSSSSTLTWKQTTSGANASGTLNRQGGDKCHVPHLGRLVHVRELQRDLGRPWRHIDHRSADLGWRRRHRCAGQRHHRSFRRLRVRQRPVAHRGGGCPSGVFFSGGIMHLDSLLSQFAGVIPGFDLGDEIGLHSLGFGSSCLPCRRPVLRHRPPRTRRRGALEGLLAGIDVVPFFPQKLRQWGAAHVLRAFDRAQRQVGIKVGLLIVDTLAKAIAAGGGDENTAKDQGKVYANLDRVKEQRSVHVAIACHPGKDGSKGPRGSSASTGDFGVQIEISGTDIRTLTITKNNEGPLGHLASFRPKIHDFGKDEDGDPVEVCLAEPVDGLPAPPARTKPQRLPKAAVNAFSALVDVMDSLGEPAPASTLIPSGVKVVTVDQWRDRARRRGVSASEDQRTQNKAFRAAVEVLMAVSKIAIWEELAACRT
jgi:autotransporter passenger strand-loop-strand repeat protein